MAAMEAWALEFDRLHAPPSPAWNAWWASTSLSCDTRGICSIIGQPVHGAELLVALVSASLATALVAARLRQTPTRCVACLALWPISVLVLLKLQPVAAAMLAPPALPNLFLHENESAFGGCTRHQRKRTATCDAPQHYMPGALELEWIDGRQRSGGRICDLATDQRHINGGVHLWLQHARNAWTSTFVPGISRRSIAGVKRAAPPVYSLLRQVEPTPAQQMELSHFRRRDGSLEAIEPLSGLGRHPLTTALCGYRGEGAVANLYNLSYLILASQCDSEGRQRVRETFRTDHHSDGTAALAALLPTRSAQSRPRNLFYDLGCTVYDDGNELDTSRGSGGGTSIRLFTRMYEERCVTFDAIYGWEKTLKKPSAWWKQVPPRMRERLHFFNTGVHEGSMTDVLINRTWAQPAPPTSSSDQPPSSFLRHLRQTARPEDYVVVKLDIDGGPEQQIVQAIARIPELRGLVDELFFEWHYHFDGRDWAWGKVEPRMNTVDHALRLMQSLRYNGVRSHFWI